MHLTRLTMIALAVYFVPAETRAGSYGALAVVPGQGREARGFGTAITAQQAKQMAMRECANARCKVVQEYQPGQCAHVVLGERQIFWNNEIYTKRELANITRYCKVHDRNCKVLLTKCFDE